MSIERNDSVRCEGKAPARKPISGLSDGGAFRGSWGIFGGGPFPHVISAISY